MARRPPVTRRCFLRIVAASGVSGVLLRAGWNHRHSGEPERESRLLMGTVVNLTVVTEDREEARSAIASCHDRMASLEQMLSRYRHDSQLSGLNRAGHLGDAAPELLELLQLSRRVSEASGGSFDITIKPVLDLYRRRARAGRSLPTESELRRTLGLVDHREVRINGSAVSLAAPGMGVTLDGIAKGYIVDAGVETLCARGFSSVLVEAGGDLMARGERAAGTSWRTGIRSPRASRPGVVARLSLRDQAAATSGDSMHSFTADLAHHHIIDPRTGYSPPELASVTVVAPQVALADALSTALMVAGPEGAARLLHAFPGCSATLVTKNMELITLPSYRPVASG